MTANSSASQEPQSLPPNPPARSIENINNNRKDSINKNDEGVDLANGSNGEDTFGANAFNSEKNSVTQSRRGSVSRSKSRRRSEANNVEQKELPVSVASSKPSMTAALFAGTLYDTTPVSKKRAVKKNDTALELDSEPEFVVPVTACQQKTSWDCGIACAYMVTSKLGMPETYESLIKRVGTSSIWTIDLAVLFHSLGGMVVTMHTETMGVQNQHKDKSFYSREFDQDAIRVNKHFAWAANRRGISIHKGRVPVEAIVHAVRGGGLAVVLVDKRLLKCTLCDNFVNKAVRAISKAFMGHFVVVRGVSQSGHIIISDPSTEAQACFIDPHNFDLARFADGTDEDVLLLSFPS